MTNWIPVSERLPTREDADEHGLVLVKFGESAAVTYPWTFKDTDPESWDVRPLAWIPIPRYVPPKPGPTNTECANILHYSALACMNHLDPKDDVPLEEQFAMVRRWFAEVTARIERERGQ